METAVLKGKTFALIATDGFEDSELTRPLEVVEQAGGSVEVISDKEGQIIGVEGTAVNVDKVIDAASADEYDGLLIPGGVANPDIMRTNSRAVDFVRDFFTQHKPVAAICHGPWLLVEADVLEGRTLTSWPSLKTDIINAGGEWLDKSVVTDQGLVTSRKPDDLDDFCAKVLEEFAEGKHSEQVA